MKKMRFFFKKVNYPQFIRGNVTKTMHAYIFHCMSDHVHQLYEMTYKM